MKNPKNVRLSPHVVPSRYELQLTPDLEAFVFAGEETIHLTLKKPTRTITLHSKELDIEAVAALAGKSTAIAEKISYDEKAETATFAFKNLIPKGKIRLHIKFRGILNDKMRGFYRSSYEVGGVTKHMATTQFEATDARNAFPCFDEPAQKAVFDIKLTVPTHSAAISNTVPIDIKEHESGYKTITFAPTPPMSTYLAAFIVGDFEYIEKKSTDGVLVRVFTTPGKLHQAEFALECAAKTITFFNKYFDIPYPLPVVDLIAIPDFSSGAMENWGAITYRESALLVDPNESSTVNKQWVALVIAHELAHQWFGNLVTMEWWTHLWLNEGFASYIEYLAVDHLFPSWGMWTQFLQSDMRPALTLDALKNTHPIEVEVHHPSEISAVFDAVSYSKGASIIRMLAEYLGEKNFRDGLRYYLKKHRYANTETVDLWNALEKVSKRPVAKIMHGWTSAGGYPLITVSESGKNLVLEQSRFFSSPLSAKSARDRTVWHIPLGLVGPKGVQKPSLMNKKTMRIPKTDPWIKLNPMESSFHRTAYSETLREQLAEVVRAKKLPTEDRLGLIRDIFAISESGKMGAAEALRFAAGYTKETEYVIWAEMASSLANMHSLVANEPYLSAFENYARELFTGVASSFSWTEAPKDHAQSLLRILVFATLGKYGDKAIRAQAESLFEQSRNANTIPADLRGVVYNTVAKFGGRTEHAALIEMYKSAKLHEEKNRIGAALCAFKDVALLQKTLSFALSNHVRSQDATRFIAYVAMNPKGTDIAWAFVQSHWKTFQERYSGTRELAHLIEPMGVSASVGLAKAMEKFFKQNPAPGTERPLAQTLEHIRANALWLKRNTKELRTFLNS